MAGVDRGRVYPLIELILKGSDQASISAKGVRAQLKTFLPDLDVKNNKAAIDALTHEAFGAISAPSTSAPPSDRKPDTKPDLKPHVKAEAKPDCPPEAKPAKRARSPPAATPGFALARAGAEAKRPRAEETDAEMAERLDREYNGGRSTRAAEKPKKKDKAKSTWKKKEAKSKSTIDSDDDDAAGAAKKRARSTSGFNKPHRLSHALSQVVGTDIMSRPQLTKQLWVYIKANGLQDPADGRNIIPDQRLRAAFGEGTFTSFQMAKKLGPCLFPLEPEEVEEWKIRLVEQELAEEGKVKAEERKPKLEKREPKEERF